MSDPAQPLKLRWRASLRFKVLTGMIFALGTVAITAISFNVWRAYDARADDLDARGRALVHVMAEALARPLFDFNQPAVEAAVDAFITNRDIVAAVVRNDSGQPVAGGLPEGGPKESAVFSQRIAFVGHGKAYEVGEIEVWLSHESLQAFLSERLQQAVIELFALLVALSLSVILAFRFISAPIGHIVAALDRLRHGETELRLPAHDQDDEIGQINQAILSLRDALVSRQEMESRLAHEAMHDALTGLPNRALFHDRLRQAEVRWQRRPERPYAVLYIDIDRFKDINDSLGHLQGDLLIVRAGDRIRETLRSEDTVARMGGDEFAVLVEDLPGIDVVLRLAGQVRAAMAQPFEIDSAHVRMTVSVGIAIRQDGMLRPEDLLRSADLAMYRAKETGKDRCATFEDQFFESTARRHALVKDMRNGVGESQFIAFFQPIVWLNDERLAGFESLVRWQHPQEGLISPAEFIPLAEETGLIKEIGLSMLDQALSQLKLWRQRFPQAPHLTVAVNLSPVQLADKSHVEALLARIAATPLGGIDHLKLEITESVVLDQPERARETLERFRSLGVDLAIDDFGTGYSSFSHLHQLPFDTLKIDRAFVKPMADGPRHQRLVRAIIGLAQDLGLNVVAEGVETTGDAHLLREMGCEMAQGFHYAKPMPPEEASRFIEDRISACPADCPV